MSINTDLPEFPTIGLTFRPDGTDSVGQVTKIVRGRDGGTVTYSYAHAPEVSYTRPYAEVRRIAWSA